MGEASPSWEFMAHISLGGSWSPRHLQSWVLGHPEEETDNILSPGIRL